MKKSLLILSLMAVAASASAYDVPTAGTAEAPNYYVIKANRGTRQFLAYGLSDQSTTIPTYLSRTKELSNVNIWAITPGTEAGTVTIKNYTKDSYMLDFMDSEFASTTKANAVAGLTSSPVNIYLVPEDGAFAINIKSAEGADYPDNCISLDAAGGDIDYCGNYIPTKPSSGEGSCFWFYKVDLSNGVEAGLESVKKAIEDEANAAALEEAKKAFAAQVETYTNYFNTYKEAVPQVADIIDEGIAALAALEYSEDYATKISEIWNNTFVKANDAMKTILNDKQYAIKSPRRAATAATTEGAYLTVGTKLVGEEKTPTTAYVGATNYVSGNSVFTFKSNSEGGYTIYNEATKTWIGTNAAPVTDQAQAQALYPVINTVGNYTGVLLCTGATSDQGLNWQSWNDGTVSFYSTSDEGDVWVLVDYDAQAAVEEVAKNYETTYSKYIATVPAVKEIFEQAIADIKALPLNDNLATEAAKIDTEAMTNANTLLTTCYADKEVNLKNLRQDMFLEITATGFARQADGELASTAFTLKPVEGGYVLYNAATSKYLAANGEYDTAKYDNATNNMITADDEADAVTVTPELAFSGDFYGVALVLAKIENSTFALNMNGSDNLWYYSANDGGSIWGITDYTSAPIDSIETIKANTVVREGIYDLQGRKLAAPIKGINIINGKKVLVK